jgi:hypothetical protein
VYCEVSSVVDRPSGEVCTVLKLESTAHDAVICEVGAAVTPVVGGEAVAEGEAELESELNKAARSSERDCMKASSLFCNSSRLNGNSVSCTLDPVDPWRASIDNIVSERSCSSAVIGRAKVVAYRLYKLSLADGCSLVVSERLYILWYVSV